MDVKAFIFDLDGTLIDSEMLWVASMVAYLADHGCITSRQEMMKVVVGHSWFDIYRKVIALAPVLAAVTIQEMALQLRRYYVKQCEDSGSILIPTSVSLLKALAKDYPVIIVSGSPHNDVENAVRLMEAEANVKFVLGAEDYPHGKPAPDGFLLGAKKLGVAPQHCVVFEDSTAGVRSAKAAGMYCVALSRPTEHPQDISPADWVLEDLSDFSVEKLITRGFKK
jgi:HAD superfamily hydrolase (TIGR01509 family)